jgi:hypothetical protein
MRPTQPHTPPNSSVVYFTGSSAVGLHTTRSPPASLGEYSPRQPGCSTIPRAIALRRPLPHHHAGDAKHHKHHARAWQARRTLWPRALVTPPRRHWALATHPAARPRACAARGTWRRRGQAQGTPQRWTCEHAQQSRAHAAQQAMATALDQTCSPLHLFFFFLRVNCFGPSGARTFTAQPQREFE